MTVEYWASVVSFVTWTLIPEFKVALLIEKRVAPFEVLGGEGAASRRWLPIDDGSSSQYRSVVGQCIHMALLLIASSTRNRTQ